MEADKQPSSIQMDKEKKKIDQEVQGDLPQGLILDDEWGHQLQANKGRNRTGDDSQEMIDDALFMP
jgi:hypothetical protein